MLFAETGVCRWWLSPSRGSWCMGQGKPSSCSDAGLGRGNWGARRGIPNKAPGAPQPFLSRVSLAAARPSDVLALSATHVRMLVFSRTLSRVQSIGKGHGYLGKIRRGILEVTSVWVSESQALHIHHTANTASCGLVFLHQL